jgi:hypothetical protein
MKTVSYGDMLLVAGACLLFPVLIPVSLGIVAYMAICKATEGAKDEV